VSQPSALAQTMHVGPLGVRVGDLTMIAKTRLEVIDLTVAGSTGKLLRFHDGTTLELRLDDVLLVHRPHKPPSRGGAHPRDGMSDDAGRSMPTPMHCGAPMKRLGDGSAAVYKCTRCPTITTKRT